MTWLGSWLRRNLGGQLTIRVRYGRENGTEGEYSLYVEGDVGGVDEETMIGRACSEIVARRREVPTWAEIVDWTGTNASTPQWTGRRAYVCGVYGTPRSQAEADDYGFIQRTLERRV